MHLVKFTFWQNSKLHFMLDLLMQTYIVRCFIMILEIIV